MLPSWEGEPALLLTNVNKWIASAGIILGEKPFSGSGKGLKLPARLLSAGFVSSVRRHGRESARRAYLRRSFGITLAGRRNEPR